MNSKTLVVVMVFLGASQAVADPILPAPGPTLVPAKPTATAACTYKQSNASAQSKEVTRQFDPGGELKGARMVCVDGEAAKAILVYPKSLPPSRMVLSFDSDQGLHREIEWDPLVSSRLVQSVTLPPGLWMLSVRSDPVRDSANNKEDYAWQEIRSGADDLPKGVTERLVGSGCDGGLCEFPEKTWEWAGDKATGKFWQYHLRNDGYLLLQPVRAPSFTSALESISSVEGGSRGYALGTAANRSAMSTLEAGASEALSILAEVLVDRARRIALDRLAQAMAENLKPDQFKRTLQLLRSSSLESVLSSSDALPRAVLSDLLLFATSETKDPILTGLFGMVDAVGEGLVSSGPGGIDPELVLAAVAGSIRTQATKLNGNPLECRDSNCACRYDGLRDCATRLVECNVIAAQIQKDDDKKKEEVECAQAAQVCRTKAEGSSANCKEDPSAAVAAGIVAVGLSAGALCISSNSCDGRFIANVLDRPSEHFFGLAEKSAADKIAPYRSRLTVIGNGVANVYNQRLSREVRAGYAFDTSFDVADLYCELGRDGLSNDDRNLCKRIPSLKRAVSGVFSHDLASAVAGVADVIAADLPNAGPLIRFTVAVGGLFLPTTKQPDPEGARRAKKAALEAAIDMFADRSTRGPGPVVGLNVGAGAIVGGGSRRTSGAGGTSEAEAILSPSARVSIDLDWQVSGPHGVRLAGSFIDLGRIVGWSSATGSATESASDFFGRNVRNLLALGFEVGYSLNRLFAVGAFFQWTPLSGAYGGGLHLTVVIPIVDFN